MKNIYPKVMSKLISLSWTFNGLLQLSFLIYQSCVQTYLIMGLHILAEHFCCCQNQFCINQSLLLTIQTIWNEILLLLQGQEGQKGTFCRLYLMEMSELLNSHFLLLKFHTINPVWLNNLMEARASIISWNPASASRISIRSWFDTCRLNFVCASYIRH